MTVLHSFTGADGTNPYGSLILSDLSFFGMTSGNVFKMNLDGTGCTNLHLFSRYGGNGNSPYAALTLSGSVLFGMTVEGGRGVGVVFRMSTNGSGYTNLHSFQGSPSDGSMPYGSLTLAEGKLHGMTLRGGANNLGMLFRVDTDDAGYNVLHAFGGGPDDGAYPMGDLLLNGRFFYGLTTQGGIANLGTLFRVNTDGSGYTNLHSFTGYPSDGSGPPGSLVMEGTTFFGMTQAGGTDPQRLGAVFRMETDGSGYRILHSFSGGTHDGSTPLGSLTMVDGMLYGMTSAGGESRNGVVFRLSADGSSYTNLHTFTGGSSDGASPHGSLTVHGSVLYGMTYYGGASNKGIVFSIPIVPPEIPAYLTITTTGSQITVSWPSLLSGWTLQTNSMPPTSAWGIYKGTVINHAVTNASTKGNLFYRLVK